jgi:DNA polymerase-1
VLVTRSNFERALTFFSREHRLSLDSETIGLRPYHGDRFFSLIIATRGGGQSGDDPIAGYFNFLPYSDLDPDALLDRTHLEKLAVLFSDPSKTWYLHNAKFDLAMLAQAGIELAGTIHCTKAIALVEYNEHQAYDLDSCAERIGFRKDDAVKKYIVENRLTESRQAATQKYTHLFYDRVPPALIIPYGCRDAEVTYRLGEHQEKAIQRIADATPPGLPSLRTVLQNERRLTRTVFRMESVGLRIDRPYCVQATRFETSRAEAAMGEFKRITGRDFSASPKLFSDVFASDKSRWGYTEKGNPSFDSDFLGGFENPAARSVLEVRDATSKANFYRGFLYHADRDDVVHPTFSPDGAGHGRFSSSGPNFQNLTSEEGDEAKEFLVRRAVIPRPGFILFMPDYDQMEYRMMLDVAAHLAGYETELIKKVKSGLDVHTATAQVATAGGTAISRGEAKTTNFLTIYGGGDRKLAEGLKCTLEQAKRIRHAILSSSPEIRDYINQIISTAEQRRYIFNWLGRRCYFPDPRFAYRAPNYHIAGGCADVMKVAMNRIDEHFVREKLLSRMIATIHDELVLEVHESEVTFVPEFVQAVMEESYPSKYLKLTTAAEWSAKSMADKTKGLPV